MKNLFFWILLILALNAHLASAQETGIYLGYRTLNYPELTIEKKKDSSVSYGLTFNYSVRYLNSMNHTVFSTSINRSGPGIGFFYQRPLSKLTEDKGVFFRFTIEYNYWESGKLKYDEGWFGGSNESYYSEYNEIYHNIGALISHIYYSNSKKIGYYYQAGLHIRKVDRQYLVEGTYSTSGRRESDRQEDFLRPSASLRMGIFFRLAHID